MDGLFGHGAPKRLVVFVLGVALALTACEKSHPDEVDAAATGDAGIAPILGPGHGGWKNPWCDGCHNLPVAGHQGTDPTTCAACHGGNGACDPNGPDSGQTHTAADDCVTCHNQQHNYTAAAECASCHFASVGGVVACTTDPVPDGGLPPSDAGTTDGGAPILPTNLTSACYDWPATPFGPGNYVQGMTPYPAGTLATDFTLRDLDGTPYTLSTLLATRPVLMVHGAFT